MSRRPLFKVALALLACTAVFGQTGGGPKATADAQPSVVSAVAPVYPPIARAARAMGAVVVAVTVNDAGDVTMAEMASGHPLLKETCLRAARRWRFAAADKAQGYRTVSLTFLFGERDDKPEPSGDTRYDLVTFMAPYTVEVRKPLPTVEH
jgi:TonB family protein